MSNWQFGYISGAKWLNASMRVRGWAITKGHAKREIKTAINFFGITSEWERGFVDAILDSVS